MQKNPKNVKKITKKQNKKGNSGKNVVLYIYRGIVQI